MKPFRTFAARLLCVGNHAELNRARFGALTRQIPLMYALIIINMMALAYTHLDHAPWYLTILLPSVLGGFILFRSVVVMRTDVSAYSDADIVRRLQSIIYLSVVICIALVAWSYSLFQYGEAYTKMHAAIFVSMTAIGCIMCMMHLPQSAFIVTGMVIGPAVIYFGMSSNMVLHSVALNILMVAGMALFIMMRYSRDFTDLIENQVKLRKQGKRLQALNAENMRLANLDSLTGLPNRRSFFATLDGLIEARWCSNQRISVGILDLDGFKPVNDVFGHNAGDQLLIETGNRLRDLLDDEIVLARLGGDEFGLAIPNALSDDELNGLGVQICDALRAPFDVNDGTARIAATIGFASFPEAGSKSAQLFERADYALCYAKQNDKGTVALFSDQHETIIREVSNIVHRLRDADLDSELSVLFQPLVDADSKQIVAFEALGRWQNPVLGNIPPAMFIRSAEQQGMIGKVTAILFEKALAAARTWPETVSLSFNLSVHDLCSLESVTRLIRTVQKSGVRPSRIVFEITETAILQDFERVHEGLTLLRCMGARIALDDFGTGYSSLSYVQRLPVDRIKIDRSFVNELEADTKSRDILRTIIFLCRSLGIDCVVEGVETQAQLDMVEQIGCNLVQGFLIAHPMTLDDTRTFLGNGPEQEFAA